MIKYSVILPCYNESGNLKMILDRFSNIINPDDTELILVNNGSTDETELFLKNNIADYHFAGYITVEENQGYGYGIMQGLKVAKGNWIGWTHADMQTDPADVIKAIDICRNYSDDGLVFVKGTRAGRSLIANVFSRGMEVFVRLVLKQNLSEINAQPNMFNRKLLDLTSEPPKHWGLDLYFYYIALKNGYGFFRIPVVFSDRIAGKSKWNKSFFSRINLSLKMIKYCFELKKRR